MTKRTEYLITQHAKDFSIIREIRAPKSANLRLLMERLICQELDDLTIIDSCLRTNSKRYYDPFQINDLRDDIRREQARNALKANPDTHNTIDLYNRARAAPIPLGQTLMFAGANYEYVAKEVEARSE